MNGRSRRRRLLWTRCLVLVLFLCVLWVPKRGVAEGQFRRLLVGTEYGYYPFADVGSDGVPFGFSVDIFEAVAREMNLDYDFRSGSWNEILTAIENKEIDALPFVKFTERRDEFLDFSTAYVVEHAIVLRQRNGRPIQIVEDLIGRSVAAMESDGPHLYLEKHVPGANLVLSKTVSEALQGLAAGEYDYAMVPRSVALVKMHDLGLEEELQPTGPIFETFDQGFSIGVQDGDSETLAAFNEGLSHIKESGEYDEIYNYWFGGIDPRQAAEDRARRILYAAAIVAVLALLAGLWWASVRRRMRRQDEEVEFRREIATTVESMNQTLQRQNERLAAYDYTIAHGLKTPLAASARFLEILLNYRSEDLGEEQIHLADRALATLQSSQETVDALLTLSTVSREKVEKEPLEMHALVEQALRQLQELRESSEASIEQPRSWHGSLGYAPWVGEVWLNYLSNAMKYSDKPAEIELGSRPNGAGRVRYWVRNNGKPLSAEEQDQLFKPFARLHETAIPGHGLGLTIVQRIVDRLDGDVGVRSLERGNEFYFELPIAPETDDPNPGEPADGISKVIVDSPLQPE